MAPLDWVRLLRKYRVVLAPNSGSKRRKVIETDSTQKLLLILELNRWFKSLQLEGQRWMVTPGIRAQGT
jgi:hypothetical protein